MTSVKKVLLASLLVTLPLGGCLDPDGPSPGAGGPMTGEGAFPSPVSFLHNGTTGPDVCVITLVSLNCPVSERGPGDSWEFGCARGHPGLLHGALTWEPDGDAAPFTMRMSLIHREPGADHGQSEFEENWEATTSPLTIEVNASRYAGEDLSFYFHGWRDGRAQPADSGVLASPGKPFQFQGEYECLLPNGTVPG